MKLLNRSFSLAFCSVQFQPRVLTTLAWSGAPAATGLSAPNVPLKLRFSQPDHFVSMNLLEVLVAAVTLSHVEGNPECDQAREESTACQAK